MNKNNLHTILSSLSKTSVVLPKNQRRLKARLLRQYKMQQKQHNSWTNIIQNAKEAHYMKRTFKKRYLSFSPLVIAVALIALTGTVGGATYWFTTKISSWQANNTVNLSVKDCLMMPLVGGKGDSKSAQPTSFKEEYKIIDSTFISKQDIDNAKLSDCEQRAIANIIDHHFSDLHEFSATNLAPNSHGLYFPIYKVGTIEKIANNKVTITDLNSLDGKPTTTSSIELANDALILDGDNPIDQSQLRAGDQIYFMYQNKAIKNEVIDRGNLESLRKTTDINDQSVIRGISKLHVDYHALQKLFQAMNNGAVEVITNDPTRG